MLMNKLKLIAATTCLSIALPCVTLADNTVYTQLTISNDSNTATLNLSCQRYNVGNATCPSTILPRNTKTAINNTSITIGKLKIGNTNYVCQAQLNGETTLNTTVTLSELKMMATARQMPSKNGVNFYCFSTN